MSQRPSTQRGFTIIELMIVIAIIAVLSSLMIGLSSQSYGASARNTSDQLASTFNLCKMRAVSTRRWHRCEVTPTSVTMWQWQAPGMAVPQTGNWQGVQIVKLGTGITIWDATSTPCAASPCTTQPTAANSALDFDVMFRPDGSSTGATVYLTDPARNSKFRVVVYKATGSSYARNSW